MIRELYRRALSVFLILMISIAFLPVLRQDVYAAAKNPGTAKILSANVSGSTVTLNWSKAKNAKKYKVFVQTGADGWNYWKSVKKSSKSKKKYSDKLKYKLKKSGKKYKVYKRINPYEAVGTTTARRYTFEGDCGTTYSFVIRAVKGKKAGKYSAVRTVTTEAGPAPAAHPENKPTDPLTPVPDDTGNTTAVPGQVTNLKAALSIGKATESALGGTYVITVTWDAAPNASKYDVYMSKKSGAINLQYSLRKTTTSRKYAMTASAGWTYTFKIVAKNGDKEGAESCVTYKMPAKEPDVMDVEVGEFSENSSIAWNQYLAKMLGYYKQELTKQGIDINSTNKADEFKKLQAIIQVMHDYVGYSEKGASDYSQFPTGRENWFYNDVSAAIADTDTSGKYYNGTDYVSTIQFYASCEIIAETQEYLAKKAGLDVYTLGEVGTSHKYAIICANYVWYNADPGIYMAPGTNGLNNPGWYDPSQFAKKECSFDIGQRLSDGTTYLTKDRFRVNKVFYGTDKSVTSTGGLSFDCHVGIDAENATYTSSDESILSFDNENGTCTFHKAGEVYVTIVYTNLKPIASRTIPTITTTISVKVTE